MISLFADIACQSTADLINQALSENPKLREALSVIGTSTIAFEITPGIDEILSSGAFPITLIPETLSTILLTIQDGELALNSVSNATLPETTNVTVRGDLMALALLVCIAPDKLESNKTTAGHMGGWINERINSLTINGEQTHLSEVINILQQVDIDWEGRLATVIGDIPAHLLGKSIRNAKTWAEDSRKRLRESYDNYRDEERQIHPGDAVSDLIAKFGSWLDPDRFNRP